MSDNWESGDSYEKYVGRWSRRIVPAFLAWLAIPPGQRWLDVGCGTGALCAAIAENCSPAFVSGIDPSEGFLKTAQARHGDRVAFQQGSATVIAFADSSFDVTVCGLVLNFVPDARAGLSAMARVTRPAGTIAAYVWDYSGKMELMRIFWDAAVELNPAAAKLDEGFRFPLCHPDALYTLFINAGLTSVTTTAIDIATPFASFGDYWNPFLGGNGPAPAYAMSLDEPARARLRRRIGERLPMSADGTLQLTARAWAVRGVVVR
jgi:SAM-dependent methyltransferase